MSDLSKERYLGDGLYARFDRGTFWLRALREDGDHIVALEPEVLEAFEIFVEHVRAAWNLNAADSAAFVQAITDPPEPNDALKKAAKAYKGD